MKLLIIALFMSGLLACKMGAKSPENEIQMTTKEPLTYLALGDSYTIGEGVEEKDRYPNQLVDLLNENTENTYSKPKIIAKTGWTVDELEAGIKNEFIEGQMYDLVTLSIGVNNQYRGRSVTEYKKEFEQMLLKAIGFAGNLPNHVWVLSIPDWGVTPLQVPMTRTPRKWHRKLTNLTRPKNKSVKNMALTTLISPKNTVKSEENPRC
ncbi:GDSL-type esterase/lipase family protein [Algoriphagus halophilus]|uniref:GDSL-type esterase/lipase family protein n=1 Tax=Algoriphagus halophilus TaxID=226505 RepID=UPI00358E7138